jgi:hypothetical protein
MRKLLLFLSLIFFINESYSQLDFENVIEKIDEKDLKYFIEVLSSDSLEGRYTGSVGQKKAAEFIAERFKQLGLNEYNHEGYFEKFNLNQRQFGEVYLKTKNKKFENFVDMYCTGRVSENEEKEIELVFGAYGTDEQLNDIDIENRMVLIFAENLRTSFLVVSELMNRKAYGVIVANPTSENQFESLRKTYKNFILRKHLSSIDENYVNDENFIIDHIHEFFIPNKHIKTTMGVSLKSLNNFIANKNIKDCPLTKIKLKCETVGKVIETENVVGFIKGKTNKSIVLSAHYDHLGARDNYYYPGADDNASGVAALFELAEVFSKIDNLNYNIIFLATTGEENGFFGSKYYLNKSDFDPNDILINLNIDMISRFDKHHEMNDSYLYITGVLGENMNRYLFDKADHLYTESSFDYSLESAYQNSSDHYSFNKKKIPSYTFFTGLHEDYHRPSDTVEKINFNILCRRITLISHVINLLQQEKLEN